MRGRGPGCAYTDGPAGELCLWDQSPTLEEPESPKRLKNWRRIQVLGAAEAECVAMMFCVVGLFIPVAKVIPRC